MNAKKITNLKEYWEEYGDRYFFLSSKEPVGGFSGTYGYRELEEFTCESYIDYVFNENTGEYEEVGRSYPVESFVFHEEDESCSFSVNITRYHLYLEQEITDKWGNTANYEDGVTFASPDCREVYYSESNFETWSDEFTFPEFIEEGELEDDLRNWLLDNYKKYDFISLIHVGDTGDGIDCSYSYYTTNKPFKAQEWQSFFADFKDYCGLIKTDNMVE